MNERIIRVIDEVRLMAVCASRFGMKAEMEVIKSHLEPGVCSDYSISGGPIMGEEQLYIGTKIVKAEPMTRLNFYNERNQPFPSNEENCDGYKVTYDDGYVSWSPAMTFQRHYRLLTWQEIGIINANQETKKISETPDDDRPEVVADATDKKDEDNPVEDKTS